MEKVDSASQLEAVIDPYLDSQRERAVIDPYLDHQTEMVDRTNREQVV